LLGYQNVSLVTNFNQKSLEFLFVKVVHPRASREFGGWNWISNALDDPDLHLLKNKRLKRLIMFLLHLIQMKLARPFVFSLRSKGFELFQKV
jgi:hypothetical protein